MGIQFKPVELAELRDEIREHLERDCGVVDSFYEDRIRESTHYRIQIAAEPVGFASISGGNRLTQFHIPGHHRRHGQEAFQAARKLESVGSAFVPTSDEFYLSHALEWYQGLEKQAYIFELGKAVPPPSSMTFRQAKITDLRVVEQHLSGTFSELRAQLESGVIFLTLRENGCVGFGFRVASAFCPKVSSIGTHTVESFRQTGVGTATVSFLIDLCLREDIKPVAGCWYYNHASKKTLEHAGMVSPSRLLKVEY